MTRLMTTDTHARTRAPRESTVVAPETPRRRQLQRQPSPVAHPRLRELQGRSRLFRGASEGRTSTCDHVSCVRRPSIRGFVGSGAAEFHQRQQRVNQQRQAKTTHKVVETMTRAPSHLFCCSIAGWWMARTCRELNATTSIHISRGCVMLWSQQQCFLLLRLHTSTAGRCSPATRQAPSSCQSKPASPQPAARPLSTAT